MSGAGAGSFFEDFRVGQELRHATPRTVTAGDVALYRALTGSRFALSASDEFARAAGLPAAPVDDLLVFHIVFGKSVADVSRNAVANLGYADCRFGAAVYPGDTLAAASKVIGVRESSNGKTGTVYVRTTGRNQRGAVVVDYARWVLISKRDTGVPAPKPAVPELPEAVAAGTLATPDGLDVAGYDAELAGPDRLWDDYRPGERIDHVDGATVEEAEHMMATRLYDNAARVHFDGFAARGSRFGRRLVYGGHVISLVRGLSFNGLAHAFRIAAINDGRHVAPVFAGDTVYAWSEVLEAEPLVPGVGALRLRAVATKDHPCGAFPYRDADGRYHEGVVLDLDYWALMPRRR